MPYELSQRLSHPSALGPAEAVLFDTAVRSATPTYWRAWRTTTHATSCSNGKRPHQQAHPRGTSTDGGASCRRWQSGIPSTRGRRPSSTRAGTRSEPVAMCTDRLATGHPSWSNKRGKSRSGCAATSLVLGRSRRPRLLGTFVNQFVAHSECILRAPYRSAFEGIRHGSGREIDLRWFAARLVTWRPVVGLTSRRATERRPWRMVGVRWVRTFRRGSCGTR